MNETLGCTRVSELKPYQILIFILIGSLLTTAVIAGIGKPIFDTAVLTLPSLAHHLNYNSAIGVYDFGKLVRHLAMGVALIFLLVFSRRLQIVSLLLVGLRPPRRGFLHLFSGLSIGFVSLGMALAITVLCGVRTARPNLHLVRLCEDMARVAINAMLVGTIEECLFRGIVLQIFLQDMRAWVAITVTSIAFSALHFLGGSLVLPLGFDPWVGFSAISIMMIPQGAAAAPEFVGIFLVSAVLSYAYIWGRSLYLPIGLHAGWVFTLQASRLLFTRDRLAAPWFFGGGLMVTGVLGIIMLICVLVFLYLVWGRSLRD